MAASPQGWPPHPHRAATRQRRAAALQSTTNSHSEALCIELGITPALGMRGQERKSYKMPLRRAHWIEGTPPTISPQSKEKMEETPQTPSRPGPRMLITQELPGDNLLLLILRTFLLGNFCLEGNFTSRGHAGTVRKATKNIIH